MKKTIFTGIVAVVVGILTSLLFVEAQTLAPVGATVSDFQPERTTPVFAGYHDVVLGEIPITSQYGTAEVSQLKFQADITSDASVPITISGSGFSANATLTNGQVALVSSSGFSIEDGKTANLTIRADFPENFTNANRVSDTFRINLTEMTLKSGLQVLYSGSGLSAENPVSGQTIRVLPKDYEIITSISDAKTLISGKPVISGKIAGNFDLTDASLSVVAVASGHTYDLSYGIPNQLDVATRTFMLNLRDNQYELLLDQGFSLNQEVTINVYIFFGDFVAMTSTTKFTPNTATLPASTFDTPSELSTDLFLPLAPSTESFLFPSQTILKKDDTGLKVVIPATTTISKKSGETAIWYGDLVKPRILSIPESTSAGYKFVPATRVEFGSEVVGLTFDKNVTVSIPTPVQGAHIVYSSSDGTNWTRETTCTVGKEKLCTFEVDHFTQFTIGQEHEKKSTPSSGRGFGGGRNHVRFGSYDPRDPDSEKIRIRYLKRRSTKFFRGLPPCRIQKNDFVTERIARIMRWYDKSGKCR